MVLLGWRSTFWVVVFISLTTGCIGYDSAAYTYNIETFWTATHAEAEKKCNEQNMHLASIKSEDELNHVYSQILSFDKSKPFWIGLDDISYEGKWKWSDGSSFAYKNWKNGEPNGGRNENCVIVENKKFLDLPCSAHWVNYICKKINRCRMCQNNGGVCSSADQCGCPRGKTGDYCEKDVNECLRRNGPCQQICRNTFGSYRCSCRVGFKQHGSNKSCHDVNECTSGPCQQKCVNTEGSYRCQCNANHFLGSDGVTCHDASTICSHIHHGCQQLCNEDGKGSFYCSCKNGFTLNSDKKTCKEGYRTEQFVYSVHVFVMFLNSWKDARQKCLDRNSELASIHSKEEQTHINIKVAEATFPFRDEPFWIGLMKKVDHWGWSDSSEYGYENWELKDHGKNCGASVKGKWKSFKCDDSSPLNFICKRKNHCYNFCKNNGKCEQTDYEAFCTCASGFTGVICNKDLNECELNPDQCEHQCVNTHGSFKCVCPANSVLRSDGFSCGDLNNVCEVVSHGCQQTCVNNGTGGYTCECESGYVLSDDQKSCTDIDECQQDNGGCGDSKCINVNGAHYCKCVAGYDLLNDHWNCTEYSINAQRYYVSNQEATYNNAQKLCENLSGYLVTISGKLEEQHISKLLQSDGNYWIGLRKSSNTDEFVWSRGSFSYFIPRESPFSKDCVFVKGKNISLQEQMDYCWSKQKFICKLPQEPPVIPEHSRYIFSTIPNTWKDAEQSCVNAGGHLVSIRQDQEQKYIESHLKYKTDNWIGLWKRKNQLQWVDGRKSFRYTNFEQEIQNEGCAALSADGNWKWKFESCEQKKNYICRIPYFQYGSYKYYISDVPMTNENAAYFCSYVDGDLISVENSMEQLFIKTKLTPSKGYWNGLRKYNGNWKWSDNSNFKYKEWLEGHPNGNKECVKMTYETNGKWVTTLCDNLNLAICKVKYHVIGIYKYTFNNNFVTWKTAEERCKFQRGQLASIADIQVQKKIEQIIITGNDYWIGYNCNGDQCHWSDATQTSFRHLITTNNYEDKTCLSLSRQTNGFWKTHSCIDKKNYICKIRDFPFDNYQYVVVNTPTTWDDARQSCWVQSGELASITSQYEERLINDLTLNSEYWIGLNDHVKTGKFVWVDGEPITYFKLPTIQRGLSEHCVMMYTQDGEHTWKTNPCNYKKKYICKIPKYQSVHHKYLVSGRALKVQQASQFCQLYGASLLALRKNHDKTTCLSVNNEHMGEWIEMACKSNMQYVCVKSKFSPDNSSYVLPDISLSWSQARSYCLRHGGHLADILYKSESEYIASMLTDGKQYWIGLHDLIEENRFTWTSGEPFQYTNMVGDGQSKSKNCFYMIKDGIDVKWYNDVCNAKRKFMCKIPVPFAKKNYHYLVSTSSATLEKARQQCIDKGADLVSAFNKFENDYIVSLLTSGQYWIGLTDIGEEGYYSWYDGSLTTYVNWAPNEPSEHSGYHCVTVGTDGLWRNQPCNNQYKYICRVTGFISDYKMNSDGSFQPSRYNIFLNGGSWSGYGDERDYNNAQAVCKSKGAQLASIRDDDELRWIKSHVWALNTLNFYVGINSANRRLWSDRFFLNYDKWAPQQPDTSKGHCVSISRKDDMKYGRCNVVQGYVCKKANRCFANPCKNLGSCHESGNTISCSCRSGFSGTFCEYENGAIQTLKTLVQNAYEKVLNKDENSISSLSQTLKDASTDTECANQNNAELFCRIKVIKEELSHLLSGLYSASQPGWKNEEAIQRRSTLLVWFVAHDVHVVSDHLQRLTDDILGYIYTLVTNNEILKLNTYASYKPTKQFRLLTKKQIRIDETKPFRSDLVLVFRDAFRGLDDFLSTIQRNNKTKSKVVTSQYDLQEKLKLAKLDRISKEIKSTSYGLLSDLRKFSHEIKSFIYEDTASHFKNLENYFVELAKFDQKKNKADVLFITGALKTFRRKARETQAEVMEKINAVIFGAFTALQLETKQLLFEAVAASSNFFAQLFGEVSPSDIASRWGKYFQARVRQQRNNELLQYFSEIIEKSRDIQTKFNKNKVVLERVNSLLMKLHKKYDKMASLDDTFDREVSLFLKEYSDYDPQVQQQDLDSLEVAWNRALEEGCELLFSGETAASSIVEDVFAHSGECIETQAYISSMMTVQNEIYTYQFDMMESLAQICRSEVALKRGLSLSTRFKNGRNSPPTENTEEMVAFQQMALGLIMTSKLYFIQIVMQYCDYREYLNAGNPLKICTEALTQLNEKEINNLAVLREKECPVVRTINVRIPTKTTISAANNGYISLDKLYNGKTIDFQIPNSDWLIQNEWILSGDAHSYAIYLKDIKLVLPDAVNYTRDVQVKFHWFGSAKLYVDQPGQVSYILEPGSHYFEYREHASCNHKERFHNPYDMCNDYRNQWLCKNTHFQNAAVLPSIYSHFKVKSTSYPTLEKVPVFSTPMYLRAVVTLCQVPRNVENPASSQLLRRRRSVPYRCCIRSKCDEPLPDKYWDEYSVFHGCKTCPAGSRGSATGHHCEVL